MDKFKKFNGSLQAVCLVALVMVLTSTLALLAAEKAERGFLGVSVRGLDDDERELFSSLVKPRGAIDPAAARVHGITPEMLAGAPNWADIWPAAQAVLEGRRVGVYNAEFDLRLMKQSHTRAWLRWTLPDTNFFCLMKLYARFYGDWDPRRGSYRWQSLEMAGRQCRISLPNAHRAVDDCRLTRALLHHMASQA